MKKLAKVLVADTRGAVLGSKFIPGNGSVRRNVLVADTRGAVQGSKFIPGLGSVRR
ncbi:MULTISPECIES: hypothetical protein [unclassified Mesorhizobium]|uniref:hypothetical protein n=1 Tax=unclassified Mesorhizobium TaxID=325217 RepID=UPI000A92BF73|nr:MULTISPECIES: hypothetical protein [unclassified Mesorhizobium]MDR7033996.1 hypothetical protein [Mesorhizobium sp. BE184]